MSFSVAESLETVNIALSKEERMRLRGRLTELIPMRMRNMCMSRSLIINQAIKKFDRRTLLWTAATARGIYEFCGGNRNQRQKERK